MVGVEKRRRRKRPGQPVEMGQRCWHGTWSEVRGRVREPGESPGPAVRLDGHSLECQVEEQVWGDAAEASMPLQQQSALGAQVCKAVQAGQRRRGETLTVGVRKELGERHCDGEGTQWMGPLCARKELCVCCLFKCVCVLTHSQ